MRLIDADALKDNLLVKEINSVWDLLKNAPTMDAVPVVRCKDCKWFDPCEWSSKYGKCHAMKHGYKSNGWDIGIYRMTNSNDFCSSAEREEIE